jgi:hypothetical protein
MTDDEARRHLVEAFGGSLDDNPDDDDGEAA